MTTRNYFAFLLIGLSCISVQILKAQQPVNNSTDGFKLFFEKVYLHLDRSYYASGDDIWFKAYLVNGQNNSPTYTSNNLYVELIDPSATIISQRVIRLDSAVGFGDFKLEDSVATGAYRIRAYTNWMRNFGNHFIFEKEIQVTNVAGTKYNSSVKAEIKEKQTTAPKFKIQFFPEGGYMVEDVPTTVAFKAEDAHGKGVEANGYIQTPDGNKVVSFSTSHNGMGSFAFIPRHNQQYKIMVQYRNNPYTEAILPGVLPMGFVMNVTANDTSNLVVTIRSNAATVIQNPSGIVTIAARHAGKSYFKKQLTLDNGQASFTIPTNDFPSGIAYITLYDDQMRPQCERLVYIDKVPNLHINISPDKSVYKAKEKATVEITVTDAQNHPVKTSLSFAAVEDRLDKTATTIQSYLLLESELPGKVENPIDYFDKNNPNRLQQLDLLLCAQGWRSFLWRQIADASLKISYLPEAGITISGTVTKPWTKKPIPGMNITLFAPDARGDKIYLTKTNTQGKYFLDGLPLFGVQTIRLNVGDALGKKTGSLSMDSLYNKSLPVESNPFYTPDTSARMAAFTSEALKRWSIFSKTNVLPGVTVTAKKSVIRLEDGTVTVSFGYPEYDFTVTPKDYQYQTLRDFLVQKVPGARYDDALEGIEFISNGKPVRPIIHVNHKEDIYSRMDYYSLAMQQIESVTVRHHVGSGSYSDFTTDEEGSITMNSPGGFKDYYLISLNVKPGNADQQLSKITTNVTGYYERRMFYSPNYSVDAPPKTDERITLYWSPVVKTNDKGKAIISFYNADPKGTIRLAIEGLSVDGTPIAEQNIYEIK